MTLHLQFDYDSLRKAVLKEQLGALGLAYTLVNASEIKFKKELSNSEKEQVAKALGKYGIEIAVSPEDGLVERIKDAITAFLNDSKRTRKDNISTYLSNTLHYSYAYLSGIFSEKTHSSIENLLILKKIDQVKHFIIHKNLTLTEIAYQLHYSSVAHLSAQFKKTTGLTPSAFQRIIKKRKEKVQTTTLP